MDYLKFKDKYGKKVRCHNYLGMVGWCEGAVYLTSPGRPTDIGLQLGKGPAILVVGRVEGECFYFFCFFTFIPVPLSSLSLSFISSTLSSISFLPFLWETTQNDPQGWRVVKPQHNQKVTILE